MFVPMQKLVAEIYDDTGDMLGVYSDFHSINLNKFVMDSGLIALAVNDSHPILDIGIELDYQIIVRIVGQHSTTLLTDGELTAGLYRGETVTSDKGEVLHTLYFSDLFSLLDRKINAYPGGWAYITYFPGVDIITIFSRAILFNYLERPSDGLGGYEVRENDTFIDAKFGPYANSAAHIPEEEANFNTEWLKVSDILKELILGDKDIEVQITGIVPNLVIDMFNFEDKYTNRFEFETVFLESNANKLDNIFEDTRKLNEDTVAIVGDSGTGRSRNTEVVYGPTYDVDNNFQEVFVDAGDTTISAEMIEIGERVLEDSRHKSITSGVVLNTFNTIYGRDFILGDIVSYVLVGGGAVARRITGMNMMYANGVLSTEYVLEEPHTKLL